MTNLWPKDLGAKAIRAPVTILKEQASLLGTRTKNVVTARVAVQLSIKPRPNQDVFFYAFYLVAPALRNYRYRLFSIEHKIKLYPVEFMLDNDLKKELFSFYTSNVVQDEEGHLESEDLLLASDENYFLSLLENIFNAHKTRQVIEALLAQSGGIEPEDDLPF